MTTYLHDAPCPQSGTEHSHDVITLDSPDRAGLLREAAQEWADAEDAYGDVVKALAEKWPDVGLVNPEDRTSPEWQAVRDAQQRRLVANDRLRVALAATGDSEGPLDAERVRFRLWDDTVLVVQVDGDDPGDMGEPRDITDYDASPVTHYLSAAARLSSEEAEE